MSLYATDLFCPYCQHAQLDATYRPPSVRRYRHDDEDVIEHLGETCDVSCPNCEFEFTYHRDQQA